MAVGRASPVVTPGLSPSALTRSGGQGVPRHAATGTLSSVADTRETDWQPISRLPMLTAHVEQGVALAREHLQLLGQARGAYRLNDADVAGVIATWTKTRTALVDLFTEQGRRWQALDLDAGRRAGVDRYIALVAEELALVEQILALADELTGWTIETLLAKSDHQVGLEAIFGRPH